MSENWIGPNVQQTFQKEKMEKSNVRYSQALKAPSVHLSCDIIPRNSFSIKGLLLC